MMLNRVQAVLSGFEGLNLKVLGSSKKECRGSPQGGSKRLEGSQGALWRSEEVCGRSCHILRSLIRAPLSKHFQRAVPRSGLCTGVAVMSQAAGEVSPSPPSLIYPIINIHRERE